MARIPTPAVQPYEQRIGPGLSADRSPRIDRRSLVGGDAIPQALRRLGAAGGQFADVLAQRAEAEENAWISRTTAEDQLNWTKREQELREGAGPGAPDYLKTVEKEWNDYRQTRINAAPSPRAKQVLSQRYDQLGLHLLQRSVVWAGGERNRKMVGDYDASVEAHAAAVRANPALLESSLRMAEGDYAAAAGTWMQPEQAQAAKDAWRDRLVDGAIEGYRDLAKQAADAGDAEGAKRHLRQAEELVSKTYGGRARPGEGFEQRLIQRESGGNPRALNSAGYAGLYQFGAPRLAALGLYEPGKGESLKDWQGSWTGTFSIPGHPDIKTLDQFLASPDAQRAAFRVHAAKMNDEIARAGLGKYEGQNVGGVQVTREGLYAMLHLGGVGGAKRALESGGMDAVRDANGTSVLDYARMGDPKHPDVGKSSKWFSVLDASETDIDRAQAALQAKQEAARKAAYAAGLNELFVGLMDGSKGAGDIASARGSWLTDYDDIHKAQGVLEAREKAVKDQVLFERAMNDPAFVWNQYDKDHRDAIDAGFAAQGGSVESLDWITQKAGVLPSKAGTALRGAIVSGDPERMNAALQISSNLLTRNPNIFSGVDGGQEIETAAVTFRHYVEDLGFSAQEAAQRIRQESLPEHKAKIAAKIKSEDINELVKKRLSVDDLSSAFDPSYLPGTAPTVAFEPKTRKEAFSDYAELFRGFYLDNGDVEASKKLAVGQMKKIWGVTAVSGSPIVIKFPPEGAPAYAGIENASEGIAKQAVEAIKEATGEDVERGKVVLAPIDGGKTANSYRAGEPPVYHLLWYDKNGLLQMLQPGKGFFADPAPMKQSQAEERKRAFEQSEEERRLTREAREQAARRLRGADRRP